MKLICVIINFTRPENPLIAYGMSEGLTFTFTT